MATVKLGKSKVKKKEPKAKSSVAAKVKKRAQEKMGKAKVEAAPYKVPKKTKRLSKAGKALTAKQAAGVNKICSQKRKPASCMKTYRSNKNAF